MNLEDYRNLELTADIRARSLAMVVRVQADRGQTIEAHPLYTAVLERFAEADDAASAARAAFLPHR